MLHYSFPSTSQLQVVLCEFVPFLQFWHTTSFPSWGPHPIRFSRAMANGPTPESAAVNHLCRLEKSMPCRWIMGWVCLKYHLLSARSGMSWWAWWISKCDLKTSLFFNFSIDQVDTHAKSFGMNPLWLHIPTHKPLDLAMVDHTSRVGRPKHRKRKPSKHGDDMDKSSVPGPTLFASYWNSDIFSIQLDTDPPASVHRVSLTDFPQTLQHLGSLKTIPTWSH